MTSPSNLLIEVLGSFSVSFLFIFFFIYIFELVSLIIGSAGIDGTPLMLLTVPFSEFESILESRF